MLLAIDMGNTQTAMGLFDGDELVQSWRMPTDRSYTADEIHVRLMGFFKMYGLSLDAVDAIAFAGVGIRISMDALAARAAKLASVPLEAPEHAIGRDTEECIKVGAVTGAAAMAEGLVARMKRELGREDATVIATGGLAGIVADSTDAFDVVDGQLTIKGICEIYRRMQELG